MVSFSTSFYSIITITIVRVVGVLNLNNSNFMSYGSRFNGDIFQPMVIGNIIICYHLTLSQIIGNFASPSPYLYQPRQSFANLSEFGQTIARFSSQQNLYKTVGGHSPIPPNCLKPFATHSPTVRQTFSSVAKPSRNVRHYFASYLANL